MALPIQRVWAQVEEESVAVSGYGTTADLHRTFDECHRHAALSNVCCGDQTGNPAANNDHRSRVGGNQLR